MLQLGDLPDILQPVVDVDFKSLLEVVVAHHVLKVIHLANSLRFSVCLNTPFYLGVYTKVHPGYRQVLAGLSQMHLERGQFLEDRVKASASLRGGLSTAGTGR